MDKLSALAASGLRSRMDSLDMLANNLANTSTTGYKADREFYSLYVGAAAGRNSSDPAVATSPVVERQWTDFSQGLLETTGNPTDLALSGQGFLAVKGPSGTLYTRGGAFQVSNAGLLTTKEGYDVLSADGQPISLNALQSFTVDGAGTVQQNGAPVAKLAMLEFRDTSVLSKQGGNYFKNSNEKIKPAPATDCVLHQGQVEASNVGTAESAVRLVHVMRQFETMQKAVNVSNEMSRKSIEEVARVS